MKQISEDLLKKIVGLDEEQLASVFTALLTMQEIEEVNRRWEIAKMLAVNTPQKEIVKSLGVGIATITNRSKELQNPESGFHLLLQYNGKK